MNALPPVQRIVLTGFMGSGKTTVGRLLAERLGWRFSDLDREVERHAGQSVPSIFAEHGETHFRELEAELLAKLLSQEQLILALGGGAPEFAAARDVLRNAPATTIVYLEAPFLTLADRCRAESALPGSVHRPLFADEHAAQQRYRRREPLYQALAHQTVSTNEISAEQVLEIILRAQSDVDDFSQNGPGAAPSVVPSAVRGR